MLGSLFVLLVLRYCQAGPAAPLTPTSWTKESFPNPRINPEKCGSDGQQSWVCNPNLVITPETATEIDDIIAEIHNISLGCSGLQVSLAVAKKMEIPTGETARSYSQKFATYLLHNWHVGSPQCENGIMFFLSLDDQTASVQLGAAALLIVTPGDVSEIIEGMINDIDLKNPDAACINAVDSIFQALLRPRKVILPPLPWWIFLVSAIGFVICMALTFQLFTTCRKTYTTTKPTNYLIVRDRLASLQEDARRNDFSTCPLCLTRFNFAPFEHLPCTHKFCSSCLLDLRSRLQKNSSKCPLCNEKEPENRELRLRLVSFDAIYPGVLTPALIDSFCKNIDDDWLLHDDFDSSPYGEQQPTFGLLVNSQGNYGSVA